MLEEENIFVQDISPQKIKCVSKIFPQKSVKYLCKIFTQTDWNICAKYLSQ